MDIYIRKNKIVQTLFSGVLAVALLLGCFPMQAAAASSAEIQQQINGLKDQKKEIQKQIDAIQRQYDENFGEMVDIVTKKETIDQEITLLNSKIEATNAEITAYGQLIADTQEELDAAEEELLELSQKHRERVRAMEEGGTLTYWEVIFQANSFMDMLDRINMVEEINASDRSRIEQMRIAADIVTATKLNLASEKSALEQTRTLARLQADKSVPLGEFLQRDDLALDSTELVIVSTYMDSTIREFAEQKALSGVSVSIFVRGVVLQEDHSDLYEIYELSGRKEAVQ